MKKIIIFCFICCFILSVQAFSGDSSDQTSYPDLKPRLAKTPPKIDGVLDDEVWQAGPMIDDFLRTYNPLYGEKLPQRTAIYLAYDPDNLYFAFYCYDTEPDKIKTSITKHDDNWNDDWVGFAIDTCGGRQFGYEFFINPDGIQSDGYISSSWGEDDSPDYIFESAGKIVKDGYIVEMRLPLKNFRFASGKDAEMNVIFWRRISRLGMSGSWPETKPGAGFMNSMGRIVYGELNSQFLLEVLPSITYSSIWDRETPEKWTSADDQVDFGVTAKYGITSTITADFTYNPDFSQVESDSFQILANQRYPIFYSEKRPFFMEAGNLFSIAGAYYNMTTSFHTRYIVDPEWGLRVSGEAGNFAFGVLGAGDEWPGRDYGDEEEPNSNLGENELYLAARAKYSFDKSNYLGAIFLSTDFAGGYNRVAGGDFRWRSDGFEISGNFLQSFTKDVSTLDNKEGSAWAIYMCYESKPFYAEINYEHMGRDFTMDTAFYSRENIDQISFVAGPSFYIKNENLSWIKRIYPFIYGYYIHDLATGEDDYFCIFNIRTYFIKQAFIDVDFRIFDEYWNGVHLKGNAFRSQGNAQWTNWLNSYYYLKIGDGSFYGGDSPEVGHLVYFIGEVTIQPNSNFTQYFGYENARMTSKDDDTELYSEVIFRSKSTYQFNEHLFLRAYVQYDSYSEMVLSDLLLSYQLNPQTVFHIGYGSLHEYRTWKDDKWMSPDLLAEYYQTSQSLFIKASYQIKF